MDDVSVIPPAQLHVAGPDHEGAMVAWFLPSAQAAKLALDSEGAEPAEDLHITLAYFEAKAADKDEEHWQKVSRVVAEVAREWAPLQGELSGWGRFASEEDKEPFVLSVDVLGLGALQQRLDEALEAADAPPKHEHGFNPHLTLAYLAAGAKDPNVSQLLPLQIEVDQLTLIVGGERQEFKLSGQARVARAFPSYIRHSGDRSRDTNMSDPFVAVANAACFPSPGFRPHQIAVVGQPSQPLAGGTGLDAQPLTDDPAVHLLAGGNHPQSVGQRVQTGQVAGPAQGLQDGGHDDKLLGRGLAQDGQKPRLLGRDGVPVEDGDAVVLGGDGRFHAGHDSKGLGRRLWRALGWKRAEVDPQPKSPLEAALEALPTTGGFSLTDAGAAFQKQAYVASYQGFEEVLPLAEMNMARLLAKIDQARALNDSQVLVGAWLNGQDGLVYLDLSRPFQNLMECSRFARQNNQQAIYDGYDDRVLYWSEEHQAYIPEEQRTASMDKGEFLRQTLRTIIPVPGLFGPAEASEKPQEAPESQAQVIPFPGAQPAQEPTERAAKIYDWERDGD